MIRTTLDGLVYYQSEKLLKLNVEHGFYTRFGGQSLAPFDSLNVKYEIGDDNESVASNRKKIMQTLGVDKQYFAKLTHGNEVKIVNNNLEQTEINNVDALITSESKLALGLSVADCLPIIISDGIILGIIHAGWRGTVLQIADKIVKRMLDMGLDENKAVAAFGPCICKNHFETEGEAAISLSNLAGDDYKGDKYFADLIELNKQQLVKNGITNFDILGQCSIESGDWFSYRQSNGKTGRNMAVAVIL
ncbi:laccase domain-containing protein [Candidatus Saccharibacteria bacterium]|jgi:YfiH family protein|nr:laccase domain-containing protein [Candidatus Saccharibacteria bacterium]